MGYTWTNNMGNVALEAALEQATRGAVIAGCTFVDGLAPTDVPKWNGGRFLRPANKLAQDFVTACMKGVTTSSAVKSQTMLTTAVYIASLFRDKGGGEAGWTAISAALAARKKGG